MVDGKWLMADVQGFPAATPCQCIGHRPLAISHAV